MIVCWMEEGQYFGGEVVDSYMAEDGATVFVVDAGFYGTKYVPREKETLVEIPENAMANE